MIFSDKDVKRLKEAIGDGYGWWHEQLKTTGLQALLARMEAAEKYINAASGRCHNCDDIPRSSDEQKETYKAWRKACGK